MSTRPTQWGYVMEQLIGEGRTSGARPRPAARRRRWIRHRGGDAARRTDLS